MAKAHKRTARVKKAPAVRRAERVIPEGRTPEYVIGVLQARVEAGMASDSDRTWLDQLRKEHPECRN